MAGALTLLTTAAAWAQSTASTPAVQVEVVTTVEPGVLLVSVTPGSPAAKAGLKRGDIVLKVADKAVNQAAELAATIRAAQAGDKLTLTVQRGDEERELTLTVGERQGRPYAGVIPYGPTLSAPGGKVHLGETPLGQAIPGPNFTFSQTVGARIISVAPSSPAAAAGLVAGESIVGVAGEPLSSGMALAPLLQQYAPGDQVVLEVQSNASTASSKAITVTLGQHPSEPAQPYLGVRVVPQLFVQAENLQPFPGRQHGRPFAGRPHFYFMQPYPHAYPPFMPMTPFGWFGEPGFGMNWWQPAPPEMFFARPVPPPMFEGSQGGLWTPGVEIENFEFAPGHEPGFPPDVLIESAPGWSEEGPEI